MKDASDNRGQAWRYLPNRPLPPYSYVSGLFPHPQREPGGHCFGVVPEAIEPIELDSWRECAAYLWGVDLFNFGYYWEAHESWEAVWHAVGRRGITADFFKGLIKLAAAGVKARECRESGVARHAARAEQLLTQVREATAADVFCGLSLNDVIQHARQLAAQPSHVLSHSVEPVVIVMPFKLTLEMNTNSSGR